MVCFWPSKGCLLLHDTRTECILITRGALASNGNLPSGNIACSDGPSKKKPETCSGSVAFSTAVAATVQVPRLCVETKKKLIDDEDSQNKPHKGGQELLKKSRQHSCTDNITAHEAPVNRHSPPSPKDKGRCISTAPTETISVEFAEWTCSPCPDFDVNVSAQGNNDKLCSGIESIKITRFPGADYSGDNRPDSSFSAIVANSSVNQGLQQCYLEDLREPSKSVSLSNAVTPTDDSQVPKDQSGLRQGFLARRQSKTVPDLRTVGAKSDLQVAIPGGKQHFQSLKENKLSDSEFAISTSYFSAPSLPLLHSNFSGVHSPKQTQSYGSSSLVLDPAIVDNVNNGLLHPWDINNSYANSDRNFEHADLKKKLIGGSEGEAANAERSDAADKGESNITSNSLSLDFDPWEEPLISSQNSVELLGEKGKSQGPLAIPNSCKAQNSNRSRFSFARPDEHGDLPSNVEPSFSYMQQVFEDIPLSHDLAVELDNDARSYSYLSSNKFSGLRSQVSAPPGFLIPNKAPSPGFTSQERMGPNFDAISGNHFPDASSLLRNPYQPPQTGNIGCSTDIKFLDPAILAVGKGRFPVGFSNGVGLNMSSNFSLLLNAVENEARFQSLMQRSSPLVQNLKFSGTGINFSPMNNTHNHLHSRIMEQSLASNLSPFSHFSLQQPGTSMLRNGQWNGWNEGKNSGDIGTELLRTESLGLNKFYGGYEDLNFHMPSSGHAYSGTYGI